MGRRKKHAPKRGSLAYLPRGRARRHVGRIHYWPEVKEGPTPLGFAGYKAGMTYVYVVDDHPDSPTFGHEIFQSVTVVESPPMLVCAFRAYVQTRNGLQTLTEAWMRSPPKDLGRVLTLPEQFDKEGALEKIRVSLDKISEFRLILCTQPRLANVPQKKPEVMEVGVGGGSIEEQFEYVESLLGKTVGVSNVFKEGQVIDVVAVTKGKGIQGPVKRWGVKKLPHKSRKTVRGVGCLGPWHPTYVMYTVPRAGQMGFHQRTEFNKRILKIGSEGKGVTPEGGFLRYGVVRGDYLILNGSVPGSAKRLLRLRYAARAPSRAPEKPPEITHISLESQQGK